MAMTGTITGTATMTVAVLPARLIALAIVVAELRKAQPACRAGCRGARAAGQPACRYRQAASQRRSRTGHARPRGRPQLRGLPPATSRHRYGRPRCLRRPLRRQQAQRRPARLRIAGRCHPGVTGCAGDGRRGGWAALVRVMRRRAGRRPARSGGR
jgi:hypothetical protein